MENAGTLPVGEGFSHKSLSRNRGEVYFQKLTFTKSSYYVERAETW